MVYRSRAWCLVLAVAVQAAQAVEMSEAKVPLELARKIVQDRKSGPEWLREKFGNNLGRLAASLEATRVDLNQDGKPDYIVVPTDSGYCGSGGCSLWIYQSDGAGFRSRFDEFASVQNHTPVIKGAITHGYLDLAFPFKHYRSDPKQPWDTQMLLLKFDGQRYRQVGN